MTRKGKRTDTPAALTVAGSDSGGGAGIQADLATFAAHRVHGLSVLTCMTAQNLNQVSAVQSSQASFVQQQLETVMDAFSPGALKTGMLYSAAIIERVAAWFENNGNDMPLVVDPVMISTSGRALLRKDAVLAMKRSLLPLATLITPNLPEAQVLTGKAIRGEEDMKVAVKELHADFGCAVLLKGGHLSGSDEAVDVLYSGSRMKTLRQKRIGVGGVHGTGCTLSAAIAANLALGLGLGKAVENAKFYISGAIEHAQVHSNQRILNWNWRIPDWT